LPPADSNLQGGVGEWIWRFDLLRLVQSLTRVWNSYIAILVPNDNDFIALAGFSLLSLGLMFLVIKLLQNKPYALLFYLLATLEILFFTYVKFLGSPRHYGMLFIILIATFWLAGTEKAQPRISYQKFLILTILISQVLAGIVAYTRDIFIPFSASRDTANYIQDQKLQDLTIVGTEDFAVSPIAAYLDQKIYYPETVSYGSYVLFNSQRKTVDSQSIFRQIDNLLKKNKGNLLLIVNQKMEALPNFLPIQKIKEFKNSFISNEQYSLYLIKNEKNP
jgi:hypothetical protein